MKIRSLALTIVAVLVVLSSCESEVLPQSNGDNNGDNQEVTQPEIKYPLVITDGKARLYVSETQNSVRSLFGKTITNWDDYTVRVNNKECLVRTDSEGRNYVDVSQASSYNAVLLSSKSSNYHGQIENQDVLHPFSYAYHNAKDVINALPHFASYNEENGAILKFSSALSLLEITVNGSVR